MRSQDENILLGLKYLKSTLAGGGDNRAIVKWCHRVAAGGNSNAQWFLGVMYAVGAGVAQSDSNAMFWLLQAAERGNSGAQTDLGIMLARGKGTIRDRVLASAWLMRAARQGNAKAARALERMQQQTVELQLPSAIRARLSHPPLNNLLLDREAYNAAADNQNAGIWKVPHCVLCDACVDEHSVVMSGWLICLNCVWTRVFR